MAEPVRITLRENDSVTLERQQGGRYALRLRRNGVDQGLLEGRIDRDTTLVIGGTGRNTSIDIPANIDFAPRVQVDTNENLRIDNGPFILANESRRSATVQTTNTTLTRPTLSFGGADEDERFPPTQAVMGFRANTQQRNIAVEPGAPGIDIVRSSDNRALFTLSGADTLQQIAQRLGVAAPQAPQPPAAQPAARPAAAAPLPAGTGPNVPFEQRDPNAQLTSAQQTMIGLEADRIRNLSRQLPPQVRGREPTAGEKALRESYERINTAAQAFKEGNHTQQELQDFRAIVETERTALERIGRDHPDVRRVATDMASIMTSTTRNIDRIARVNWKDPEPRQAPPRNAAPPAVNPGAQFGQQQESIGRIATQAEQFSRSSDNPESRRLMGDLATAARAAERNPNNQEAMRNLNTALDNALEGSRRGVNSGRSLTAPDEVQRLERFKQQLNGQQPGQNQGANIPAMPDHVLAAAGNALAPSLTRQQAVQSDQNNIRQGGNLPGTGGIIQIS